MKPSLQTLRRACPEVDARLLRAHLERLGDRYFDSFAGAQVVEHVKGLSRVSREHPVEVLLDLDAEGRAECTVLAFDYPAEFSLIAGVLASMGLDIESGDVFTYRPADQEPSGCKGRRAPSSGLAGDPLERRRIIDRLSGRVVGAVSHEAWAAELRSRLSHVIGLLERRDQECLALARQAVNEMVGARLADLHMDSNAVLYPVHIQVDNGSPDFTCMRVVSEDTPFFLYALSAALSLHHVSIEHVSIRTFGRRIEDEFYFLDSHGRKLVDPDELNQVKLSVLLTKQFTYFLCKAPDPYAALCRFETLVESILQLPQQGRWFDLLSNPRILQDLARLLGASDFLWEDFIRLQYETLLPMLGPHVAGRSFAGSTEDLAIRLERALSEGVTPDEKADRLNDFKDQEIFHIDLDHILNRGVNFQALSDRLTRLAEGVVAAALRLAYGGLAARFGSPGTVAGMEARHAVLGLGKFGGAALGYASDLELLLVYSDSGVTQGPEVVENREFFEKLVKEAAGLVRAKREGIFHIDLRLRPFGQDGPLACSLESFCRYYGKGGQARSYERLSLVRLRAIAGDATFGRRIERLRDEMVCASPNIDLAEMRELREKQFREAAAEGGLNAKFSPGALVDLEYTVQILQVTHGQGIAKLRTPRIHEALAGLTEVGVLADSEARRLVGAYDLLRRLINGLRMLRGNARDLYLPQAGSDEYAHLARRMGYEAEEGLAPAQQLHLEFETRTAAVRAFVEKHLGRRSLPGPAVGNVADLVLSGRVPHDLRERILADAGFTNLRRAYVNLRSLAGGEDRRDRFAELAVLACDLLAHGPDPDMALNNWERFVQSIEDVNGHYETLLSQPMRLELLLSIFAGSQFLADALVRNPEFLDWVTSPEKVRRPGRREDLETELRAIHRASPSRDAWLDELRRFRRREMLRIGARDICLGVPTPDVMRDLSVLAESLIQAALEGVWRQLSEEPRGPVDADRLSGQFCVMALGKLGGFELNYSSDVDLLGVYDSSSDEGAEEVFARAMAGVRADLSTHTAEGYAFRVDLRLRPHGRAGQLVASTDGLMAYYEGDAALWEIQALLKMRPVAGSLALGDAFLQRAREVILSAGEPEAIVESVEQMRRAAAESAVADPGHGADVKSGPGGLRDVEFLVQGLQLIHGREYPDMLTGNTLAAIHALAEQGILRPDVAAQLDKDYVFLRRVEHCLQILEDRQIHAVPTAAAELTAVAKRILGAQATAEGFTARLDGCLARVRDAYRAHLIQRVQPR